MPSPAKPTTQEEETFMKTLLDDLDDHFLQFNATPCDTTPAENATRHSARPTESPSRDALVPLGEIRSASIVEQASAGSLTSLPRGQFNKPVDIKDIDMDALCDGADDWDWQDLDIDDCVDPLKRSSDSPSPPPSLVREKCTRCEVLEVSTPHLSEKRLVVEVAVAGRLERREILLKQDWIHTEVTVGDWINILGNFTPFTPPCGTVSSLTSTITITSSSNMLILHPDLLLSATTIANAPSCTRKPLISLMLSSNAPPPLSSTGTSQKSPDDVVVWGNFLHEVVQGSLAAGTWDKRAIEERIDNVIRSHEGLGQLVKLGVGIEKAKSEVRARASGLQKFAERFVGSSVKKEGQLSDPCDTSGSVTRMALTRLHEVEEDIWSPTYGLKGKIDASVQVLIQQDSKGPSKECASGEISSWTLPFEIKTGRAVGMLEHRAQTIMYAILVAERYGVEVPSGLLYYTQSEEIMRVASQRNELRGLIMARNDLASYMMRKRTSKSGREGSINPNNAPFLPSTLDDSYRCSKCYVVDGCMLYRKAVEGVEDNTSDIALLYNKKVSHLTPTQCEFFKKWEALVSMEEQDVVRFRKELWTLTAEEREQKGRCFGGMTVHSYKHNTAPGVSRAHQHVYRFVREIASVMQLSSVSPCKSPSRSVSLLNGSISTGDAITVSVEPSLLAIARGFVIALESDYIEIGFDHEVDLGDILKRTRALDSSPEKVVCRLDKDEFGSGLGRIRDNLARLFYANGDTKRLSLVVDLAPPLFDDQLLPQEFELPPHLNVNQKDAVRKVLSALDYAIVLGMPGTGKTSTIAEIINLLVARGKTVLLASYTHSAVDTILMKLTHADYPILRLGSLDKVHPDIHKYTLAHQSHPTTIEQLEHRILDPPVVATTCLSLDHPLFARRYFDVCIVDEASQVTLPTCLGPLRYADKFVLVGDHFQLPPLIRSRDARAGGLDVSLFKRLVDAHPEAVVDLVYQYRMNDDIMLLSNKLIYHDRLRCDTISVSKRTLALPDRDALNTLHTDKCRLRGCWLERLLDEKCKAVFVDTDNVPGKESRVGDLIQNEVEAELVFQVTEALLHCGVNESDIGVISLYRQQIKLLSRLLHRQKGIELLTADRSQGRDKECIIISMVKSNPSGQIGDLLKDWRRINVSFTRARSKLIIIGSKKTLRVAPILANFFDLMETNGWILSLGHAANTFHVQDASGGAIRSKRSMDETDLAKKENRSSSPQKKTKMAKVDRGILKGRPMLQDIVNDVS